MPNKKILAEFPAAVNATKDLTQKQKDVLITSIQLFAKQGYANTSTHQIAVAAHQSEGTMFKHFKSKANILRIALEPIIHQIIPNVLEELKQETLKQPMTNLHDFLEFFVRNRMAFADENQDAIKVFFSELLYNETLRQEFLAGAPATFVDTFRTVIQDFQQRGLMVTWPFPIVFRHIMSIIGGYVIDRYILFPDRPWDDDEQAHYLVMELEKVLSV
ncbi:TetR/AcrR family transcriptional regulator [Levilactobacillus acidifarinae]|uniref:Transcriptional regulator, TetR family n=1 Tax=Levilactobacillus acidifarinae DSM 19394 = JCM 15949 TaxID=1423715 RepID=A0A0R1LM36_9LACO|nr:TetR/AcrR family transcriptional regulator [Levilactobacillus acidifarinae]KRK96672.1 transcriptional regulator, TetR family [Levilactobacillus acidifarinae DSM 19394]GEO70368.1 TetR family transcriptional regulator [Levilactobacillus acidifarinae]